MTDMDQARDAATASGAPGTGSVTDTSPGQPRYW